MVVASLDSAEAASDGRRWEHEGAATIANNGAQESRAQLPCRPQYPRIRTGRERTTNGICVVYRGQEDRGKRSRFPGVGAPGRRRASARARHDRLSGYVASEFLP